MDAVMTVRLAGGLDQLNVVALLHDRFERHGLGIRLVWQEKLVVRRVVFSEQAPEFRKVELDPYFVDGCQQMDTRHDLLLLMPPLGLDEALLLGVAATAGIPVLGVSGVGNGLILPEFSVWQAVYRPVTAWAVDMVEAAEMVERIYGCLVSRQYRDDSCEGCDCTDFCAVGR